MTVCIKTSNTTSNVKRYANVVACSPDTSYMVAQYCFAGTVCYAINTVHVNRYLGPRTSIELGGL